VPEEERWLSLLEQKGDRITEARRAIVKLLVQTERALTPVEIFDLARNTAPKMGLVTVYRTLELLEELGLVERVHGAQDCHTYLRAARGHEHLVICNRCGKAVYFSGDDISDLIQKVSRESGFVIQEHWLQMQGLCKDCQ